MAVESQAEIEEQRTTDTFKPFVPADEEPAELTPQALILGALLGIVFGASSLYLFLKIGMTVSASIPVAVLSITLFRAFSRMFGLRPATILENNIVQTAGSAGESIAFGVGAAMPALMILGYDMEWSRVLLVSVLGGILGILMMIPLRKAFIVKQHDSLPYPEGTACAKVLIAGEKGGSTAATVFGGFGLAFVYQVAMQAMKLWTDTPRKEIVGIAGYKGAVVAGEVSPALLGVGYILGPRIGAILVGGGILASFVLVPAIFFFGQGSVAPLYPGQIPISEMSPEAVSKNYVKYIGAGAVATGGIISMLNALPLIFGSLVGGLRDLRAGAGRAFGKRTDRDLPLWIVGLGSTALVAAIAATHLIPTNPFGRVVGAVMILVFGFLFVTVSSRLTGLIGSSSNPISGMTIATLLITCGIFYYLGWIGSEYRVAALSIAAIVCIASSNGGTTSQDLKTGYLVGATPQKQQLAILVGALTSAVVIGGTLLLLNSTSSVKTNRPQYLPKVALQDADLFEGRTDVGPDGKTYRVARLTDPRVDAKGEVVAQSGRYLVDDSLKAVYLDDPGIGGRVAERDDGAKVTKFSPPQPELFAVIIDGIMKGKLPWGLVLLGVCLAIVMQLAGVSPLAFAVGVYLPLATTLPIFIGGLIRATIDRVKKLKPEESDMSPAILLSTGLIAGGSIAGILCNMLQLDFASAVAKKLDMTDRLPKGWLSRPQNAVYAFAALALVVLAVGLLSKKPPAPERERVEGLA